MGRGYPRSIIPEDIERIRGEARSKGDKPASSANDYIMSKEAGSVTDIEPMRRFLNDKNDFEKRKTEPKRKEDAVEKKKNKKR